MGGSWFNATFARLNTTRLLVPLPNVPPVSILIGSVTIIPMSMYLHCVMVPLLSLNWA